MRKLDDPFTEVGLNDGDPRLLEVVIEEHLLSHHRLPLGEKPDPPVLQETQHDLARVGRGPRLVHDPATGAERTGEPVARGCRMGKHAVLGRDEPPFRRRERRSGDAETGTFLAQPRERGVAGQMPGSLEREEVVPQARVGEGAAVADLERRDHASGPSTRSAPSPPSVTTTAASVR